MATYNRVFSVAGVVEIQKDLLKVMALAERLERVSPGAGAQTARSARKTLLTLSDGLDRVALRTAANATSEIRKHIESSKSGRPRTGNKPNLSGSIRSRALHRFGAVATGEVGVADVGVLDQLVNPRGPQYGPYWRAQELGTTHQKGRVVYGGFFGTGMSSGPFAPNPAQSSAHPIFNASKAGPGTGKMTIGRELRARHFIRDGADVAEAEWRAEIRRLEARAQRQLRVITRPSARRGAARRGRRP